MSDLSRLKHGDASKVIGDIHKAATYAATSGDVQVSSMARQFLILSAIVGNLLRMIDPKDYDHFVSGTKKEGVKSTEKSSK